MPSKVAKWLSSYKPSPESIEELASWMYTNMKLIEELEEDLAKLTSSSVPEVCQRFFVFYKSRSSCLHNFTVFFLPSLICAYLSHRCDDEASPSSRKSTSAPSDTQQNFITNLTSLESCLIAISRHFPLFNVQSTNPTSVFHIPSLSEASVFHDPIDAPESFSAQSDVFPKFAPPCNYNRVSSVTHLIRDYINTLTSTDSLDSLISLLSLHSMSQFCKLCDRVASLSARPRIPSCPSLYIDLLMGLDIILFKLDDIDKRTDTVRRTSLATRSAVWSAINEIEKRATYGCLSGPLLTCRAILHSRTAQYGSRAVTGFRCDGSLDGVVDISSLLTFADEHSNGAETSKGADAVRTARTHPSAGVEVITNASFRPEMLPEDISVNEQQSSSNAHIVNLSDRQAKARRVSGDGKVNATDSRHRSNRLDQAKNCSGLKLPPVSTKKA